MALTRYIAAVVRCELPHKGCVPMREAMRVQNPTHTSALIIAAIALLGLPGGNAVADDLLGMYVGGSVGQSHLRANPINPMDLHWVKPLMSVAGPGGAASAASGDALVQCESPCLPSGRMLVRLG